MVTDRAKRKLSALPSAKVKVYSPLIQDNEPSTVQTFKAYCELMTSLHQEFSDQVVDSPRDNVLAELGSVVDAVECAVKVQQELKEKNAEIPENCRIEFRIGINIGDGVEEEDQIYDQGANITARVERLAEKSGICFSETVYERTKKQAVPGL